MKRILAVVLTFCMMVSMVPLSASAESTVVGSGTFGEDLAWVLTEDGTLTISGTGDMGNWDKPWISMLDRIQKVVIEEGVTRIGNWSFHTCTNLTSVMIPDSVTDIGLCAFSYCSSLTNITIPESVTGIGDNAFQSCSGLTCITIPENVNTIGTFVFSSCDALTEIYFRGDAPETVNNSFIHLTANVFYPKDNATWTYDKRESFGGEINWIPYDPNVADHNYQPVVTEPTCTEQGYTTYTCVGHCSDSYISDYVPALKHDYQNCSCTRCGAAEFSYSVKNGVATIAKYLGDAEVVTIPGEIDGYPVHSVGCRAFYYNEVVKSIIISEGIRSLGSEWAFSCSALESIFLPATFEPEAEYPAGKITGLSPWPLHCPNLKTVTVSENSPYITVVDGVLYNKDITSLLFLPPAHPCTVLEIPEGVISIGSDACSHATNLEQVIMPDTVEYIGYWTFDGAENLREINISESCCFIGQYAFQNTALKKLHIPASLTAIAEPEFYNMGDLEEITVDPENPAYSIRNGALYLNEGDRLVKYIPDASVTRYEILEGTKEIGWYAFARNGYLTEIYIPDSVRAIAIGAFDGCENLKEINLPYGISQISQHMFMNCINLPQVTIPDDVTIIDKCAFSGCWSLELLEIPANVAELGENAFLGCHALEAIWFKGDAPTIIGNNAFSGVTATAYYPAGNETWTSDVMQDYGGNITWVPYGEEETYVQWIAATTSLNGTIDLNIYIGLSDNILNDPNAYVRFIHSGVTVDVPMSEAVEAEKRGDICYRFSCEIFAKQVADTVTIQVMDENGAISDALEYSVMKYCVNQINKNADPELVAVCKALLNYAAAAQTYFDYNTGNLANASLSDADKVLPEVDASAYKFTVVGSEPGIKPRSATLMLEAEVAIRVYFTLEEGCDISDYTFTIDGKEVAVQQNDKGYYIESDGIPAKELDDMHQFSVGGLTVNYGALSYVNSKAASTDVLEANLAKALYAYYAAAEALLG